MTFLTFNALFGSFDCLFTHVLFRGEISTTTTCLKYKMLHFVKGFNKVPCKVFCHFPLIRHIERMYKWSKLVELMSWHSANISNDGLVCLVCDSKAWKHIDSTWLDSLMDLPNIILCLSLDEVNPYANLSTNHSTSWLILFFNYNLLPWLTTKQLFVMLSLSILRKESMKNYNIDVYLKPLGEEL